MAAILALLSLLLPADIEQHVAACLRVMGLALNARAEQDWMGDKGGHQKPSLSSGRALRGGEEQWRTDVPSCLNDKGYEVAL